MTNGASRTPVGITAWVADLTHVHHALGADTFPLGAGCIATYAESRLSLPGPVRVFRYPDVLAQALDEQGCPDVIGFSNYIWNSQLSLAFARLIKRKFPRTIVVLGGPNYPLDPGEQTDFLRKNPQVDFYVIHEGEAAFTQLLIELDAVGLDKHAVVGRVPGVHALYRDGAASLPRDSVPRLRELDEIPSPYLTGKFDEFFDGRLWPLLQTKRGCPFTCTFCTEGLDYYAKINRFSPERVREEVDYVGRRMKTVREMGGRNDLYIADSNFGMYKEDIEAAKALARSRAMYGWPDHINCSTGKNQKERVMQVADLLEGAIVISGSVQTLTPDVLGKVRRNNISAEQLFQVALAANRVGANSYCELILGLPGETKESHLQTIEAVVNAGFNKVLPYQCMILPGSELSSDASRHGYRMEIRSRVLPRGFGVYHALGERLVVADIEDVCIATDTLSFDDYLDCRQMHLLITIFFNDVVFESLRKLLRLTGAPVYRWLSLLNTSVPGSALEPLFTEFRRHTANELWPDREALERSIQEPGMIERYLAGEIGFNLLYTFKAIALTQHLPAVAEAARRAALRLLEEKGMSEDPALDEFVEEAIRWDVCRMSNIILDMDHEVKGTFVYDIPRFMADAEPGAVEDYRSPITTTYRYLMDPVQQDMIERNLNIFGCDAMGIGRLMSNAHTKKMFRTPQTVDIPLQGVA
jgi:radical SAM superfamily enzyme YgiQ (UPF0313 family)